MPAFKPCSTDWNKRTKFHIEQAKNWQDKADNGGRPADCHRAEAHMDEARRTMQACATPHALQEQWRSTSRSVLASCAKRRGRAQLRGTKREPPPVYHPRMGPPPGVPYFPEKQKTLKGARRRKGKRKSKR